MSIQDLRIGSYVLHKGVIHYVSAISASHKVYIQPRMAKIYIPCDVSELEPMELTPDIFKQLKFETNGEHFQRESTYITNTKWYAQLILSQQPATHPPSACARTSISSKIFFTMCT